MIPRTVETVAISNIFFVLFPLRVMNRREIYRPNTMENNAIRLYRGPVGRGPGKKANKTAAFSRDIIIPDVMPSSRKAVTIGISQRP